MDAAGNERDAVNETISIFSDRLRTPLTAIVAQVEMLIGGDYGAMSAAQHKALELVRRNNTQLLHVIEDAERSIARVAEDPLDHHPERG